MCLRAGQDWFLTAALGVLLGTAAVLLPFVMRQVPLPKELERHRAFVYLAVVTVLLSALIASCRPRYLWAEAYPLTAVGLLYPWLMLVCLRYIPLSRCLRASAAACAVTALLYLARPLGGRRHHNRQRLGLDRAVRPAPAVLRRFFRLGERPGPRREHHGHHNARARPRGHNTRRPRSQKPRPGQNSPRGLRIARAARFARPALAKRAMPAGAARPPRFCAKLNTHSAFRQRHPRRLCRRAMPADAVRRAERAMPAGAARPPRAGR